MKLRMILIAALLCPGIAAAANCSAVVKILQGGEAFGGEITTTVWQGDKKIGQFDNWSFKFTGCGTFQINVDPQGATQTRDVHIRTLDNTIIFVK